MRGVPPGPVCGSGWLVCEVLLPSRVGVLGGDRALWPPLQTASWARIPSGRVLLGHHGPASLTGCPLSEALCLSSLWSLVLTCPPHPSPSPSLSLSLFLYSPPLPSLCPNSLVPLPSPSLPPFLLPLYLPSSSTFCPMLIVKVTATETSHLPPKVLWLCPGPK